MNILVACKIVPDDQDVKTGSDGSLDFSRAHQVVSTYDLNAIEAAALLAEANPGSTVKAISVGSAKADDSKTKKNILARGVDELFLVADDAVAGLDAFGTAAELARLAGQAGDWDVIITGDGSADLYAKQTGAQLAAALNVPFVSGVVSAELASNTLSAKRLLETEMESVEIPLPAVISVAPEFAEPRIAGMKDILAAGKKPMNVEGAAAASAAVVEEVSVAAPAEVDRKREIFTDVDEFIAAVKAAL
ncbi:electron transfer flavoprotein, beta subunit [Cryptobacterium curtum DSM 15641]|uniref:Electron transfer flavoprotein small subunit n=1 Tax=Cryptobacterium curtum (strain ATCC 700683 / DSM 15641 / CCUG 43107 / 12-3) TaxID=469378 RepID=C7MNU0_CRYCD|nr:electron transfer flavoprotein FixB [Cryptobacterium curtum]ACU94580.1 electron transfer flavoprotein, beta subunit [Cryptobacterium curtum DSM 15641]